MKKQEVLRYIQGKKEVFIDDIVDEYHIKLFVNERESFLFQTFPLDIDELAIGFLHSKGIISSIKDITQSVFNEMAKEYHISLRGGLEINYDSLTSLTLVTNVLQAEGEPIFFEKERVFAFMEKFTHISDVFAKTGAVHSAAISNTSSIEYFFDDIGRHNAIDKCIGKALINDIPLRDKILLVTCRISSEIILKLINSRIPIIISRAPPTAYAVELGIKFGITIIGFCRGPKFNVYTHMNRILDKEKT